MKMHDVGYYSPESLQEVLDIIDRVDDTKILAGGTDVVPSLNEKMIPWPQNIVSIKNIKGLRLLPKLLVRSL
jgi:CO/xanthine dehydrogenase FAD-binding subunit